MTYLCFLLLTVPVPGVAAGPGVPAGPALQGEAAVLRLAPPEGQVSRYHMTIQTSVESPMMQRRGAAAGMQMSQEIFTTATVTGVEGDRRQMTQVIDSALATMPGGTATGMPDLSGIRQSMTMDTRGRVVSMQLDTATVSPQLRGSMEQVAQSLGGASVELPARAVKPGDSWEATRTVEMPVSRGMEMAMTTRMRYTLERFEQRHGARHAIISMQGTVTQESGDDGAAMPMQMSFSGEMDGEMTLDLEAGRVSNARTSMTMEGQVGAAARQMPMTMRMNMTMELLDQ